MKQILSRLYEHDRLSREEARQALLQISLGKHNHIQVASFITVFQMRSVAIQELQGFRDALLELCVPVNLNGMEAIDIVGTGGDAKNTFNVSTLSAVVVAGAGYKLLPGENTLPFAHREASVAKRAGYMWKHLWVTPYRPDENYPAGDYPNQHPGGDGLPRWTAADRPVANEDIVVWYVMGSNHIPRLEDWPIMPVATIGFALKPSGFFDQNPALDVPPSMGDHCSH